MDTKVKQSLNIALQSFADQEKEDATSILSALDNAFEADLSFLEKVALLDEAFDDNPRFEELREYIFDLLMINFFAEDVQKLEEDYLDSEEWEQIEEDTLERGSELLNLLLYLSECKDADIEPSLEDYLTEFLLVEEDEFQDEHMIYESVIANQILTESTYGEIAKTSQGLSDDEEIKAIFYPMMSFFNDSDPDQEALTDYVAHSDNKGLDLALYQLVKQFNQ